MDIKQLFCFNIIINLSKNGTNNEDKITLKTTFHKTTGYKNYIFICSYLFDIDRRKLKTPDCLQPTTEN